MMDPNRRTSDSPALDDLAEDPAEAWALIERYATAALLTDRASLLAALQQVTTLVAAQNGLPDESVHNALVNRHHLLGQMIRDYDHTCGRVRQMVKEHYRRFPSWQGPGKEGAA
jgi:hypothetical protein